MTLLAIAIAVIAYAAVGLGHDNHLPLGSLIYGAGLAVLVLAAHFAIRRFAPYADPVFLPLAAVLNGLGLVLIHRLDLAAIDKAHQAGRHAPQADAPLQLVWTALGIAAFVGVLVVVRDHRLLQRYTYTAGLAGLVLLALPAMLPARFSTVHGARIWIRVAGFSLQPGELAKLALMVFFAGYLVSQARRPRLGQPPRHRHRPARGRDLGPVLAAWVASMAVLVLETRPRHLAALLRHLHRDVVRRDRAPVVVAHRHGLVRRRSLRRVPRVRARPRPRRRLAAPVPVRQHDQGYQLVQSMFGLAFGGILGTGLGEGRPDTVPFANSDFIVADRRRGARPGRADGSARHLRIARTARAAGRPRRA